MSDELKWIALEDSYEYLAGRVPEILITEGDRVAMVAHETRGEGDTAHDYFAFRVVRIERGEVVESWDNFGDGSAAYGIGTKDPERHPASVRTGIPEANKALVTEFFRGISDTPNLRVAALVAEGDLVVIASELPQAHRSEGARQHYLFDAFRIYNGEIVEHWGGQDPSNLSQPML